MAAAAILDNFEWQRLTIYLYSAHRAVVYAIAQLSCTIFVNHYCVQSLMNLTLSVTTGILQMKWKLYCGGKYSILLSNY